MYRKKIIINAMMINKKSTGLGIYSINLLNILIGKMLVSNFDIILIINQMNDSLKVDNTKIRLVELNENKFYRRNSKAKKIIKNEPCDIYYSLSQHYIKNKAKYSVITIHDVIPLAYPKGRIQQYVYYRYFLPVYLKNTQCVITVSNYTKNEIQKVYGYENTQCVYNGNNYRITPNDRLKSNYFLIVGINYSYKNITLAIDAIKNFDEQLIIVGNYDCSYGKYLIDYVKKHNLQDKVVFKGYVSEDEKIDLYINAQAVIITSRYEGFGFPVIEAMSFGTPVICSDSSCLPEICGDAALLFKDNDINDLVSKIEESQSDDIRKVLRYKGYKNIQRFSWDNSADEIIHILNDIGKKN